MASGDTLAVFDAMASRPPASGFATIDFRGDFAVVDFADATSESTYFFVVVPSNYSGGGLTVRIVWTAESAASGDVVWNVRADRVAQGSGSLDTPVLGVERAVTVAASASVGGLSLASVSLSAGDAGAPAAGDLLQLMVSRDAPAAGDTMAGDAEVVNVELREA